VKRAYDNHAQFVPSGTNADGQAQRTKGRRQPAAQYARELALGVILLLGAVLLALRTSGEPAPVARLVMAAPATNSCGSATPVLINPDGTSTPLPASVTLNSNAYRRIYVCEPATLTLQAHGSAVGGVGARLSVAWQDTPLFDEPIDGDHTLSLQVPGAGWVLVAFTNDLNKPPADRNLQLDDIDLQPVSTP